MNRRRSERCGRPSLSPPFSLISGGSIRARPVGWVAESEVFVVTRGLNHALRGHRDQITIVQVSPMTTNIDHRKAAEDSLQRLMANVQDQPQGDTRNAILEECESLRLAIRAFH